jgi:hypothetical protein
MATYEKLTTVLFWDTLTENISIGRISTASSLFVMKYKGQLIETTTNFNLNNEVFKKVITVFFDSYQLSGDQSSLIMSLNGRAFGSISLNDGILHMYSEDDHDDINDMIHYADQREWQKMNQSIRTKLQTNN